MTMMKQLYRSCIQGPLFAVFSSFLSAGNCHESSAYRHSYYRFPEVFPQIWLVEVMAIRCRFQRRLVAVTDSLTVVKDPT